MDKGHNDTLAHAGWTETLHVEPAIILYSMTAVNVNFRVMQVVVTSLAAFAHLPCARLWHIGSVLLVINKSAALRIGLVKRYTCRNVKQFKLKFLSAACFSNLHSFERN